ncbi:MAG TPA: phosphatidylglycerophosphatase A [Acidobacteriaceae bacterium]|nr:phosphatidylglycerophosphatase A [Acidobacteriaceae bacterium]
MTTKIEPGTEHIGEPSGVRTRWAWLVATFFGAGRLKPGPGTWGSLAATVIWYFALRAAHLNTWTVAAISFAGVFAVTIIGIPAASIVEREWGREDPGFVVIDEVAGQWLVLAATPLDMGHALVGFLLFRIFDIVKPPPARQLERLHGGTGIMLDDLAAGIYGLLVMLLIRHWW